MRPGKVTDWWSLPNGEDWLLTPVREGMIRYGDLKDGSLTLEDLFILNTYLRNETHNREVAQRLREKENGS